MKSLSRQQLDSLLQVARKHSEADYAAMLIGFNHALRVSEILALSHENVQDGHLCVQRLKGSNKTTQPLLASEKAIVETLAAKGGRFFSICRKTLWMHMKAYAAEAGIPEFLAHPHVLKHTSGRLGFKGGMSIPDLVSYLGHKNPANSLIYAQSEESEAAKAFAAAVGQINYS
jgi:integrase